MKVRNTGLRVKRLAPKDLRKADSFRCLIALLHKYSYRPWIAYLKQTGKIISHAQTKKCLYEQFTGGIKRARDFFKVHRKQSGKAEGSEK